MNAQLSFQPVQVSPLDQTVPVYQGMYQIGERRLPWK